MDKTKKVLSHSREEQHFFWKSIFQNSANASPFLLNSTCLVIVLIVLSLYLIYPSKNTVFIFNNQDHSQKNANNRSERCDLFKGKWIPDARGSLYTNYSCKTIPQVKNCFLQGRKDTEFLNWRWKPDECELPVFDPKKFLSMLQGKTMAFVGDSVARNQMDSLLCLLSLEETPILIYKDDADENLQSVTWKFQEHNFLIHLLWAPLLFTATERIINGSSTGGCDVQLDKVNPNWFDKLPSVDYAIISAGPWFFQQNYLYESNNLIGCHDCGDPNVTNLDTVESLKIVFRSALNEIRKCEKCKKIHVMLRTFSPEHYEGSTWNTGGRCNRTRPYMMKEEIVNWGGNSKHRNAQVEEFETARNETDRNGNAYEVIDITDMMLMRADGHPGEYYGKKWMKGYNDCVHWCLPGPIDTWNELLLEMIKRSI